jgi:hypothetical protein
MLGPLLTRWTIRLALLCYVLYLAGWLGNVQRYDRRWPAAARGLWTLGCGLFVVHVACAFAFHHGWSHAAAWESTAAETDALLGVRFGDGIYFSYVFLAVWMADVIAMWVFSRERPGSARPLVAAMHGVIHVYLFFIAFNGAIVFEAGPTRWGGIVACLALAGLAAWRAYNGLRSTNRTAEPSAALNPEP